MFLQEPLIGIAHSLMIFVAIAANWQQTQQFLQTHPFAMMDLPINHEKLIERCVQIGNHFGGRNDASRTPFIICRIWKTSNMSWRVPCYHFLARMAYVDKKRTKIPLISAWYRQINLLPQCCQTRFGLLSEGYKSFKMKRIRLLWEGWRPFPALQHQVPQKR